MNYNQGKRICDECRHFFLKSFLISTPHGQYCRDCDKILYTVKLTRSRTKRY